MFPLDPTATKVVNAASLKPGTLFFIRRTGRAVLAVALQGDNRTTAWLLLSGSNAFRIEVLQRPDRAPTVMALPFTSEEISLRVDPSSGAPAGQEHTPGSIVASETNGLCIAATWGEAEEGFVMPVVALQSWEHDRITDPAFAFRNWALSVIDKTGDWVDLVIRDAP